MLVLPGPAHAVQSLAFAPNGTRLYAAHDHVGVHVWDLVTKSVSALHSADGRRVFPEFVPHPGGRWAFGHCVSMSGDFADWHRARIIDLASGRSRPFNFIGYRQSVAVSPDGRRLVTIGDSLDDKDRPSKMPVTRLYGWTMTASGPRYAWHRDTPDNASAWSVVYLDSDRLVTIDLVTSGQFVWNQTRMHKVTVRSAADGKPRATLAYPHNHINQILASPDGRHVVARLGTSLWVWNAARWKRAPTGVPRILNPWLDPLAAAFHPSGRYLLLAINGPSVEAIDTTTWRPVQKWKGSVGVLRAVAVSADGKRAAAAGPRGSVVVWDLDL